MKLRVGCLLVGAALAIHPMILSSWRGGVVVAGSIAVALLAAVVAHPRGEVKGPLVALLAVEYALSLLGTATDEAAPLVGVGLFVLVDLLERLEGADRGTVDRSTPSTVRLVQTAWVAAGATILGFIALSTADLVVGGLIALVFAGLFVVGALLVPALARTTHRE